MKHPNTIKTAPGAPPFPPISLTEEDWLDYFDTVDATDAEKIELVRALWLMMMTFADLHWQLQLLAETSGQLSEGSVLHRQPVVDWEKDEEEA